MIHPKMCINCTRFIVSLFKHTCFISSLTMKPTSEQLNFFVCTMMKNDYNGSEIHHLLANANGAENVAIKMILLKNGHFFWDTLY